MTVRPFLVEPLRAALRIHRHWIGTIGWNMDRYIDDIAWLTNQKTLAAK
jgi:hypothetical protein